MVHHNDPTCLHRHSSFSEVARIGLACKYSTVELMQVVAFVKGTRRQPQCGFSYKVLSMLNELGASYEVLNVLDEVYNPGLREAIKEYSQWPTIPQVMPKQLTSSDKRKTAIPYDFYSWQC